MLEVHTPQGSKRKNRTGLREIEERFLHFAAGARFASEEKDRPLRSERQDWVDGWSEWQDQMKIPALRYFSFAATIRSG
jgi:hypothetical protein